jgi:DNA polymerase III subunit delta
MSGPPKPIYVIFGSDDFLRDEYRGLFIAEGLGGAQGDAELSITRYDDDAELAAVLDDLRTLPFLGDRRVVIVEPADGFVSKHKESLEKYLANPSQSGSLILMVKSFASNLRLFKVVAKVGQAVDCASPDQRGAGQFIRERAKKAGRQIDNAAVQLMVQWLGTDLARAASEVDKLVLYTQGRAGITAADVSAVVVATAGVNPFAIVDALMAGDAKAALEVLEKTLTQSGEEYRLLGLLGWHLRRVFKAAHLLSTGRSETQVFTAMKVYGPGQSLLRRYLARKRLSQIAQQFRLLIKADLAMKTGQDGKAILQSLVVALCQ